MAGLSGIVKKISNLVTGTPADDDCFVFGKSDLKKITLAKLKDALGITSINSALATNTRTVTGIFVDLQIVRSGNVVWIRISSEAKKTMSRNQTYELFKLDIDLPIHSLYRRVQIDDSHGFFFRMTTDGQITLTPYTTDISQGDGVNVSEVYLSN